MLVEYAAEALDGDKRIQLSQTVWSRSGMDGG
jgi:hypothetical protein